MSSRQQPMQQLLELPDERVDVDDLRLQHLPPAEGQQLPRERGRALARRPDLLQVLPERILLRHVVQHQVAVAEDRREEIVEVVSDAAGERADRLHLLHLAEVLFQPALVGDVASP